MDNTWSGSFEPATVHAHLRGRLARLLEGVVELDEQFEFIVYAYGYQPALNFDQDAFDDFRKNKVHYVAVYQLGWTDQELIKCMRGWAKYNDDIPACVILFSEDYGFHQAFLEMKRKYGHFIVHSGVRGSNSENWERLYVRGCYDYELSWDSILP